MAGTTARTVQEALAGLATWRHDEAERRTAELAEIDQELAGLRTAMDALGQQVEALEIFRAGVVAREEGMEGLEIERGYEAIFAVMGAQAQWMAERSAQVAAAEATRSEAALASLATSDAADLYEEYLQFKQGVEPTLAALPESYRSIVLSHHRAQAAKLRAHVSQLLGEPVVLEVEPLEVEVVYGLDAPEGVPELLIAVLPVGEEVHARWPHRPEDLQTHVAARVVQAIYQAVAEAGPEGAQALCGGHQGLLAVETELEGARSDIGAVIARCLAEVADAPELRAARVRLTAREVPVDYLLPPETGEEDEDSVGTEVGHD